MLTADLRNAAWLLIIGGALGVAGAFWPPYRQWTAPLEEGLRVIATHPVGWRIIHLGFVTGIWVMVLGLVVLAHSYWNQPGGRLALIMCVTLAVAALCWTANISFRLGPMVMGAKHLLDNGVLPDGFSGWTGWPRVAFFCFSLLAYLSIALSGWLVLQTGIAPRMLGWVLITWGLSGGFVIGASVPVIAYVPYILMGGFILKG